MQNKFCLVLDHFAVQITKKTNNDIQVPKSKSYHSKSVKIVPEFGFTTVVWNSTNKYLLGFIAVTFTSFLKHIKQAGLKYRAM